jgi:hypothetical protein
MAPLNRTKEFREAVKAKEASFPPTKRVKFGKLRPVATPNTSSPPEDAWTKQAEQVVGPRFLSYSRNVANIPL